MNLIVAQITPNVAKKSTMYSLLAKSICKYYSGTLLFEKISFSLGPGDVLAITGWNGSGKSTLLRIIAGLVRPSAGQIQMMIGDNAIPKESRRRFLGLAAPALCLYEELTGLENLEFFCKVRRVSCDHYGCVKLFEANELLVKCPTKYEGRVKGK